MKGRSSDKSVKFDITTKYDGSYLVSYLRPFFYTSCLIFYRYEFCISRSSKNSRDKGNVIQRVIVTLCRLDQMADS